jgi:hypothetical protein
LEPGEEPKNDGKEHGEHGEHHWWQDTLDDGRITVALPRKERFTHRNDAHNGFGKLAYPSQPFHIPAETGNVGDDTDSRH